MNELLTALAITTAILSIVLAFLKISEFLKNRPILKFTFMYPGVLLEIGSDKHEKWFILDITNIGQRPVLVKNFYMVDKGGQGFVIAPDHQDPRFQYPKTLKETENMSLKANFEEIKKIELKELGIVDSSGKHWKLSRKQIREINKTSLELKQKEEP